MALAAQIPCYKFHGEQEDGEEVDGGGYWSSPEDHMRFLGGGADDENSPSQSEPSSSPTQGQRSATMTAWSDSEMM